MISNKCHTNSCLDIIMIFKLYINILICLYIVVISINKYEY